MIWTTILNFFLDLLTMLFSLLPDVDFPISLASYTDPVATFISRMDVFVSVQLIATCVTVILVFDNWNFFWRGLMFLYDKLPFT